MDEYGEIVAHRIDMLEEGQADHEQRVRALERLQFGIAAGIALLVAEIPIALWIASRIFG